MSKRVWYHKTIKPCVLTDVINWKTSEKSYEDLYERFGNDALLITSHRRLFNKLIRETQKLEGAQTNINDIMFNESMHLRYRILLDVISKVPVNTSYEELCEMMGNVDYPEFVFWYYRFYNGQRDLDYDQSKYPKQLTFYDLPTDVIEKIVEKLDIKSRYILREVSRSLKCLVDSSKLVIGNISFNGDTLPISTNVDGINKSYFHYFRYRFGYPIVPITYLENAVCRHLSTFIKNPKLQLGTLDLNICHRIDDNRLVVDLFKSITHQLHVKSLKLRFPSEQILTDFIRFLKPRILKKIEIGWENTKSMYIHGIFESEQWKQAEEVVITNSVYCNIAHFFHFKCFDVCLTSPFKDTMVRLRNGISKSSNFEWCRFRNNSELHFIKWPSNQEIQRGLGLKKQIHNNMEYFVYNIPNSTKTLVFSFFDNEIFIKKSNCTAAL